jgi:hypothetical protein
MKVGDPLNELLLGCDHPANAVNMGAAHALNALYEHHCPDRINSFQGDDGGVLPAAKEIPGEALALIRQSLVAALEAFDRARADNPSGPIGLVPPRRKPPTGGKS